MCVSHPKGCFSYFDFCCYVSIAGENSTEVDILEFLASAQLEHLREIFEKEKVR